jgi:flagellar protein FliS
MCYKGAIKYLMDAKSRHDNEDYEGFSELLEKAHRVIFHLYTTLDMERGGEIAQRLADIYAFMISQIYLLNATKEVGAVEKLVGILETLKEGWAGMDLTDVPRGPAQPQVESKQRKIVSVEI